MWFCDDILYVESYCYRMEGSANQRYAQTPEP